jgi:antitoxin ParD1/3/4
MPTQNVNLTEHQSALIHRLMDEGRYKNASEVVRAGLRLLECQEEEERLKLERLRAEVQKGVDDLENGRYVEVSNREEIDALFEKIRSDARRLLASRQEDASKTPAE